VSRPTLIWLLMILTPLIAVGPGVPAAGAQGAPPDADPARVVALTNVERQKAGLAPLSPEPRLMRAAQGYAEAMAAGSCFAHDCPPIADLPRRVEGAGYQPWGRLAENIAAGQRSAEQVVAAWMESAGHRQNILNPDLTEMGIGRAAGGTYGVYWAQVFGAPGAGTSQRIELVPAEGAAARVADLLNAERRKAGLAPLSPHPALVRAAQGYADVLAGTDCFGLECGPEPRLAGRVEAAGYTDWTALAQAIAAGQPTPEEVAAQWLESARSTVLDPRYTELGIGVAYGGRQRVYWTQVFGAGSAAAAAP
jgi:uncharacterized protein YkwD